MKHRTHCKRGHKFTAANEIWFIDVNGKDQRTCRKCYNHRRNVSYKIKYRSDEEFRKKEKARVAALREKRIKQCVSSVSVENATAT